jgi:lysophospholipase L1-like esterase
MKHWIAAVLASLCVSATALAENVRTLGRTMPYTLNSFDIQWPGSGFETVASGSIVTAQITDTGKNWLNVEVNGRSTVLALKPGQHVYTLYSGEPAGATIRVTRRTGASSGVTRIGRIRSDGSLAAPPAPQRRILAVGDSVAAGFGVEGDGPLCAATPESHNADAAFPALSARAYGADIHLVSVESAGVTRSFDGARETIDQIELLVLPAFPHRWKTPDFVPDVIIIHAGANDFAAGDPGPGLADRYRGLLETLRLRYPGAAIIATFGSMLHGAEYAAARGAVASAVEARLAGGDTRTAFVELVPAPDPARYGCSWHPGAEAHRQMAAQVNTAIEQLTGWSAP